MGIGHVEIVDSVEAVEVSMAADDRLIWLLSQGVDEVLDTILSVPSVVKSLWNDDDAETEVELGFGFWSQYIVL